MLMFGLQQAILHSQQLHDLGPAQVLGPNRLVLGPLGRHWTQVLGPRSQVLGCYVWVQYQVPGGVDVHTMFLIVCDGTRYQVHMLHHLYTVKMAQNKYQVPESCIIPKQLRFLFRNKTSNSKIKTYFYNLSFQK